MNAAEAELDTAVTALEMDLGGSLAYHALKRTTGWTASRRADEIMASASTYKLALLLHAAREVGAGRADWATPLHFADRHRSWGTGILGQLSAGLSLPLRDVCQLMTALSDNSATDLLVETFGLEAVNRTLSDLGFRYTRLLAQNAPRSPYGRPPLAAGQTTPAEMVRLLLGIQDATFVPRSSADLLLEMLAAQQDRTMIARHLPTGWYYAGKTGSNADLRADVGVVTSPGGIQIVLALYAHHPASGDWSVDSPGTLAVARLAQILISFSSR
ncbi:serine hydrolase [Deinococcus petrolearius]|uniref:Serine hydrolase n=1 Tax=Deinococcus petrolearius TaxID=1751295 RepID=A0ABW1DL97_9DEIO